jgi:hypothetical protein
VHLGFTHPVTGEKVGIHSTACLRDDAGGTAEGQFAAVLERFAWSQAAAPLPAT